MLGVLESPLRWMWLLMLLPAEDVAWRRADRR